MAIDPQRAAAQRRLGDGSAARVCAILRACQRNLIRRLPDARRFVGLVVNLRLIAGSCPRSCPRSCSAQPA